MDKLRFEVRRTRGDIWKANIGNLLRSPGSMAWYIGGAIFVASLSLIVTISNGLMPALLAAALVFLGMIALYALIVALSIFMAVRKTMSVRGALDPIEFTLTPEGLGAVATSGHGQSSWDVWPVAFETRSLFVLRHQFNLIHVSPKRDLVPENVIAVRATLTRYVKKTHMQKAAA